MLREKRKWNYIIFSAKTRKGRKRGKINTKNTMNRKQL